LIGYIYIYIIKKKKKKRPINFKIL
jgi:hypothetical protein